MIYKIDSKKIRKFLILFWSLIKGAFRTQSNNRGALFSQKAHLICLIEFSVDLWWSLRKRALTGLSMDLWQSLRKQMDFRELPQIHTESFFWYVRKIFRKTNISYPLICTQSSYSEQIIETNFFLHQNTFFIKICSFFNSTFNMFFRISTHEYDS